MIIRLFRRVCRRCVRRKPTERRGKHVYVSSSQNFFTRSRFGATTTSLTTLCTSDAKQKDFFLSPLSLCHLFLSLCFYLSPPFFVCLSPFSVFPYLSVSHFLPAFHYLSLCLSVSPFLSLFLFVRLFHVFPPIFFSHSISRFLSPCFSLLSSFPSPFLSLPFTQ
jgi:hypothetical protein